jgi:hypothetical protein
MSCASTVKIRSRCSLVKLRRLGMILCRNTFKISRRSWMQRTC